MRLSSRLIWLLLFIPLLASGWGPVFAAAFCPYMASVSKPLVEMADEHASCPLMQNEPESEPQTDPPMESHCNADSKPAVARHHESAKANESVAVAKEKESVASTSEPVASTPESVEPFGAPCTHCFTPSAPVPAPLNLANDKFAKRITDLLKPDNFRTVETPLPIVPARICNRSGAPPGNSTRSYILHHTFLI
jgi:hypothetical protein